MGSVEEEDKGSESQSEVWTNVCVRKNKSVQNESEKKKSQQQRTRNMKFCVRSTASYDGWKKKVA